MRVPEFLSEQHVLFETLVHPPAFTAQKRAKYLGVPGKSVAKAVLLSGPEGYLLAVLPATHHIDPATLALALGGPVRIADGREIADVFRDCERGVVEPFGRLYGLPTILDDSIPQDSWIVIEAHTHEADIRIHCRDFERLEKPRRLRFAHP
jgi:Ala-tRNA(Pro) deacylase